MSLSYMSSHSLGINDKNHIPIKKLGVMDSGNGGLSVVGDIISSTDRTEIVYFADFKNSPYGNLSKDEVRVYVEETVRILIDMDVDAILLACNTATSVSVEYLRNLYSIPIFGMEPAIKPAIYDTIRGKILVLATNLTLKEDRFLSLKNKLDPMNRVVAVPCPGLSSLIDEGRLDEALNYIQKILDSEEFKEIHSIVLGCTHYVFLEDKLKQQYPYKQFFHGNQGTVRHLLQELNIDWKPIVNSIKDYNLDDRLNRILSLTNIKESNYKSNALNWVRLRMKQNLQSQNEL